jgi:DNA-binding transcriptional LysR family regulator
MAFTFKQLRYFLAVVDAGKVSDAAIAVNISPSSISEAIKDLEFFLEAKLFARSRFGLELTPEGYRFLAYAKRILSDIEGAKHFLADDQSDMEGSITIGTTATVSGYFLPRLTQRFHKAFPKVEIVVKEESRVDLESMIDRGELDIAVLLVSNVKPHKNRNMIPLIRSQRRLWVSADHHLLQKNVVTLEDVSKERYIQLLIDEAADTTLSYWRKSKRKRNIVFSTVSVEGVRSLVATGAGVTILSDMVYRPWSLDGDRIETIEIKERIPSMDTGLLWNSKRDSNDLLRHFIDFCRLQYTSGSQGGS